MKQKLRKWLFVLAAACLMVSMGTLTVRADDEVSTMTTVEMTVTYGQTEAREMLELINDFRAGGRKRPGIGTKMIRRRSSALI